MDKVIITAAITGAIAIPTQSPYLPFTPEDIANEAIRSWRAGAAVVHIHVRDPKVGSPSADLDLYRMVIQKIMGETDLVICLTTGAGRGMTIEERTQVVPVFKPELASVNMGSINFSIHPLGKRFKPEDYRFEWEKTWMEGSRDFVFRNTFADLEGICRIIEENQVKPELEIYDVGHLYNASYLVGENFLKKPLHMQFVTGILGGIASTVEDLVHLNSRAQNLFGKDYTWSVIGAGFPAQFRMAAAALAMGGHVRVGLEDSLQISKGKLAESNAQQVEAAVQLSRLLGREPATPDEARSILRLKGKDRV
ncbi:MAG: 3-keto-5-aminohexanoate cleavage protein, partial [Thermodesulfobacteriota bacterium]